MAVDQQRRAVVILFLVTFALLRYQFNRWNLVDFVVGPTDVFWQGDPLYAQVPRGLTPY